MRPTPFAGRTGLVPSEELDQYAELIHVATRANIYSGQVWSIKDLLPGIKLPYVLEKTYGRGPDVFTIITGLRLVLPVGGQLVGRAGKHWMHHIQQMSCHSHARLLQVFCVCLHFNATDAVLRLAAPSMRRTHVVACVVRRTTETCQLSPRASISCGAVARESHTSDSF
jgi:hypothetical protein